MRKIAGFENLNHLLLLLPVLLMALVLSSCKTTQPPVKATPQKPVTEKPVPQQPEVKETVPDKKNEIVKKRIALIMPFELEQNFDLLDEEKGEPQISPNSLSALNFYEGAMVATDSLQKQNIEIKLNSFDAPSDSAALVRMMTNAVVKEADLVFATLPYNLATVAATVAKNHNIKLVLTQAGSQEVIKDNPQVALAFASTKTQCREMVNYMLNQFSDANIILVYRTVKREDELANVFRQEIISLKGASELQDFNATKKEYTEIVPLLSKTKRNLVFLISSDEAFVSPVLSLLEEQNIYGIKVSGLPKWLNFESIDFMVFKNLQVHLFDNNFFETDQPEKVLFRKSFINRYYIDPMPAAYNGFDLVYNLGLSLRESDSGMDKLMLNSFSANKAFNFTSTETGGVENKMISVLLITDYKLERLNK